MTVLLICAIAAFVAGCGSEVSSNPTGAIGGTVHVGGTPITSGTVTFHPASGSPISVEILADASFTHIFDESGTYRVTLAGDGIPARYGSSETSELVVKIDTTSTVPEFAEFELEP